MAQSLDLAELQAFAERTARQAGAIMLKASEERWRSAGDSNVSEKKNSVDIVTETDQAVERFVFETIAKTYPGHELVGEESFAATGEKVVQIGDGPAWIVDPIDGTLNFVHGFPAFCIAIGFAIKRVPVVGVIYNPSLDQLWTARQGGGAFMNGRQLPFSHPSPLPLHDLSTALIIFEGGSDRSKRVMDPRVDSLKRVLADPKEIKGGLMAHGLRSQGSAALNICAVAAGYCDMYQEVGCMAWDCAGGVCILREAGGRAYGRGTKPFDEDALTGRHFSFVRAIGNEGEENVTAQDRLIAGFMAVQEDVRAFASLF